MAMLLATACATVTPKVIVDPTVAYPFTRATLQRADVAACADRILALGWYGRVDWERAAFLRIDERGGFTCDVWPANLQFRRTHWAGPSPEGTVAVIHSHPRTLPDPSPDDRHVAQRLQIPVIVVTPEAMTMVKEETVVRVPYDGLRSAHR